MNNLKVYVLMMSVCLCLVVFGYFRGCQVTAASYTVLLMEEQTTHRATRSDLEKALDRGMQWKLAYEKAQMDTEAVGVLAAACIAREKDWQDALEQQEAVFREMSVHPRTVEERTHVADDATRRKAALVLNAAW